MEPSGCIGTKINLKRLLFLATITGVLVTTSALECYSCDSSEDPECATRPGQQIAIEECASEIDECIQVVVAGITKRGCLLRLFPSRYCPEPCDRCTKSLCNRDIFPVDRLRCYQCSGLTCVDVEKKPELLLPCPFYKEDDRCITNVLHTSNVERDCESSIGATKNCQNICLKCNRSGCNNELGVTQQNCLQCTHMQGSPNPECWRGQDDSSEACAASSKNSCQNKNLYGHEGKCFTYVNEQTGVVQRGCSSSKPSYPNGILTECYGEYCNTDCLTISCNVCSSQDEPGCMAGKYLKMERCEENTQSCFTCESGNHVTRGCADKNLYSLQNKEPSTVCHLCRDSNGCNRTPVRTCYSCSSLDNKQCSTMSSTDEIPHQNCSSYDDLCVSTIFTKAQYTYVLRGCSSHLLECTDNDPLCVRCNGSLCNNVPIDLSLMETKKLSTSLNMNGIRLFDGRNSGVLKYSWKFNSYIYILLLIQYAF